MGSNQELAMLAVSLTVGTTPVVEISVLFLLCQWTN